jgi:hypothetical protein
MYDSNHYFSRNRLSPYYINIAMTRYNKLVGAATQSSPKEKKRETNADIGRSTKQR